MEPEPKSTAPVEATDLPIDVVEIITQNVDFRSRMRLRKVSHDFRFVVDQTETIFEYVSISVATEKITLSIKNGERVDIVYCDHRIGCDVQREGGFRTVFAGVDFFKKAMEDLVIMIKSSKCIVKQWTLQTEGLFPQPNPRIVNGMFNHLRTLLSPIRHQLQIEKLFILHANQEDIYWFLQLLKPRIFNEIDIRNDKMKVDQLKHTEQWKNLQTINLSQAETLTLEDFIHCRKVLLYGFELSSYKLISLIENIRNKGDNFEEYIFMETYNYYYNNLRAHFGDLGWIHNDAQTTLGPQLGSWMGHTLHYCTDKERIPGTEHYLRIEFKHKNIVFRKVSSPTEELGPE